MISRRLISLSLWLAVPTAWAQTAEEFFNGGAQLYISNNIPVALEKVEAGRKQYPDNEKLKKLEELLKQQQQSQSQQNQQDQNQKDQQKQQQQKDQKQDQKQNQQNKPDQKQGDRQKESQPKPQDQEKNGQKPDQKRETQGKPAQMTPQEAKRLLDSEKNEEKLLMARPDGKPPRNDKQVKDW